MTTTQSEGSMQSLMPSPATLARYPNYTFWSDGRIFSLISRKWLTPLIVPSGYRHVVLCTDAGKKRESVHRLIAEAFHGPPPAGTVVNHKNCDAADNRATNLEWVSQSENVKHAYAVGRRSINAAHRERCAAMGRGRRTTDRAVETTIRKMFTGRRGDQTRIARELGLSRYVVARVIEERQ